MANNKSLKTKKKKKKSNRDKLKLKADLPMHLRGSKSDLIKRAESYAHPSQHGYGTPIHTKTLNEIRAQIKRV